MHRDVPLMDWRIKHAAKSRIEEGSLSCSLWIEETAESLGHRLEKDLDVFEHGLKVEAVSRPVNGHGLEISQVIRSWIEEGRLSRGSWIEESSNA